MHASEQWRSYGVHTEELCTICVFILLKFEVFNKITKNYINSRLLLSSKTKTQINAFEQTWKKIVKKNILFK